MTWEDKNPPQFRQPNKVFCTEDSVKIVWFSNKKEGQKEPSRRAQLEITQGDFPGRQEILVYLDDSEDIFIGGVSTMTDLSAALTKISDFVRYRS